MSTNTATKDAARIAEVEAAIAENPYCGYAMHKVLTQDGLREKIRQIVKESLDEVYKPGEWEEAYDNANRILNRGVFDEWSEAPEDPEDYEEDFVEVHYSTLYDYVNEYPLKASEHVVGKLEKIGFVWIDVTYDDDFLEAFVGNAYRHDQRLPEFYGEKMGWGQAKRIDGFDSYYDPHTPEDLLHNWSKAIDDLISDLRDLAVDPFEDDED